MEIIPPFPPPQHQDPKERYLERKGRIQVWKFDKDCWPQQWKLTKVFSNNDNDEEGTEPLFLTR